MSKIFGMQEHYIANSAVDRQPNTVVGFAPSGKKVPEDMSPLTFEGSAMIRSGSIIYAGSTFGDGFQTGHNVMIREACQIGKHVMIGTGTVVDGTVKLGDFIKIESNCYIPTHVEIGDRVFIGPNAVLTNDRLPLRQRDTYTPEGPIIEDDVTIGGGVVLCPGVRIGKGSFIAAGAVVTKDVPAGSLVKGNPGRIEPLPQGLQEPNIALSWRKFIGETGLPEQQSSFYSFLLERIAFNQPQQFKAVRKYLDRL